MLSDNDITQIRKIIREEFTRCITNIVTKCDEDDNNQTEVNCIGCNGTCTLACMTSCHGTSHIMYNGSQDKSCRIK